jgi:hypothetical protein
MQGREREHKNGREKTATQKDRNRKSMCAFFFQDNNIRKMFNSSFAVGTYRSDDALLVCLEDFSPRGQRRR